MRQESAGVTEALLDSARREFMEHGFHGASLRRISADSGVSTNSIYTRFGDKAGLFAAVVGPVADACAAYLIRHRSGKRKALRVMSMTVFCRIRRLI